MGQQGGNCFIFYCQLAVPQKQYDVWHYSAWLGIDAQSPLLCCSQLQCAFVRASPLLIDLFMLPRR